MGTSIVHVKYVLLSAGYFLKKYQRDFKTFWSLGLETDLGSVKVTRLNVPITSELVVLPPKTMAELLIEIKVSLHFLVIILVITLNLCRNC